MELHQGDIIYLANYVNSRYSIQSGKRPYLIVSNDMGNKYSTICLVVPLTSHLKKMTQPTHTLTDYNNSVALCEQIITVSQLEVTNVVGHISSGCLEKVKKSLCISLNIKGE